MQGVRSSSLLGSIEFKSDHTVVSLANRSRFLYDPGLMLWSEGDGEWAIA